ncbi:MAG: glycosyltransferase family 4 protein [Deltaproteobacteria bacterium]|nr:glycosyltransferase family 4 protein [Deltaproteobacteria bacterium]
MTEPGLYLTSFISGVVGAWVITKFGRRLGFLDHPNGRSSHFIPTPKGGGIGIFAAFLLSCLYAGISIYFWFPLTFLSILAFWNDRSELSPKWRLSVQFLLIILLLTGAGYSTTDWGWHWPWVLFGAVFIVGTTNIYNFMDGINGIAAVTGILGFGLLAFYFHSYQENPSFFILSTCISISCLGFLPMNMPRAWVFMGDTGSILLGGVFGSLVYLSSTTPLNFLCMSSFLFPFYADELLTMFVRLRDRESLIRAHRRHIYQLLANEKGLPHWKVSVGYGILQAVVGIGVLGIRGYGTSAVVAFLAVWFFGFWVFGGWVRRPIE